ncbi:hypothetical protein [Micromonospora sp. NPDC005189]|uniref:hypothetical protein n=1 Tax=unclassified Micromonospora TaxID=2617518 RepID=UPI0033BE8477
MMVPFGDALQLDEEQAGIAAAFFESYANTVLDRSDTPSEHELMDAASSLREAGQWALLFDPDRARGLLNRAGHIWLSMGHPFGAFLIAAFWTEESDRSVAVPYADDVIRRAPQARTPDKVQRPSLSLTYPHQQAYLLLALAAVPNGIDRFGPLAEFAASSPQHNGVAPIGALGAPIRLHWRIATALLESPTGQHRESAAADIAGSLAEIAELYGRTIDSAMANRYLWQGGGAPVEVADLDIVGVISIAAAQLGPRLVRRHLAAAKERLTNARGHIILDIGEYMITGLYD